MLILPLTAMANVPTITLLFDDQNHLCTVSNKIQFGFNYKYTTKNGYEYFSGTQYVNSSFEKISVPIPKDDSSPYIDFEITSQGDCGDMDFDYFDTGNCYLTNLIKVIFLIYLDFLFRPQRFLINANIWRMR